jgi:hypothetical protein
VTEIDPPARITTIYPYSFWGELWALTTSLLNALNTGADARPDRAGPTEEDSYSNLRSEKGLTILAKLDKLSLGDGVRRNRLSDGLITPKDIP